jgi:hypothetical protein
VFAGMPSLSLTDLARMRLESISFFLLGLLVSALVNKLLWNWLRRDFSRLPILTYRKSLAIVSLWGLLFILVLTMISGARELMTPGAWERDGFTYRLRSRGSSDDGLQGAQLLKDADEQRFARLSALKAALWEYARQNDGRLPASAAEIAQVPAQMWETPELSGARYVYVPGRRVDASRDPVAYEPAAAFTSEPWVLLSDGQIRRMRRSDLRTALGQKGGS